MEDRGRPRRIEGRPFDQHRFGLLEIRIDARGDEGVCTARQCSCRPSPRHRSLLHGLLMLAASSFSVAPLAKYSGSTLGGFGFHFSRATASASKIACDSPTAVQLVRIAAVRHRGGDEVVAPIELVPEPLAGLVDHDHVLPVRHGELRWRGRDGRSAFRFRRPADRIPTDSRCAPSW
jgi:hypothetical protein